MKRKLLVMGMIAFIASGFSVFLGTGAHVQVNQDPATLTLGGLFPLTGTLSGGGVERDAAARMAVAEINADSTILPNTELKILIRDTGTDATTGAAAAQELIDLDVVGLVGAASSTVSKAIGVIAATAQVPQISYSSTNADLSDKTTYPYFLRVVPPDSVQGVALANILDGIGITEVATLATNDDYGQGGIGVFETAFEALGHTVATSQQFQQGASDVLTQLQAIVDSGAKVIVLNVIVGDAKTVFSQAADVGITPENGYQWVGTDGATQDQVFTDENNNVDTAIRDAMKGMFGTAPNRGEGANYEAFLDIWEACRGSDTTEYAGCGDRTPNTFATFAYDAVWAFAHAFDEMLTAGSDPTVGADLLATLAALTFDGATGPVAFDANYDRLGVYDVLNHDGTNFVDIGNWDQDNGIALTTPITYSSGFDPTATDDKAEDSDSPGFGLFAALFASFATVFMLRKKRS